MGTEVLRPQDCLLRPSSALRNHHQAKPFRKPAHASSLTRPKTRKQREASPNPAKASTSGSAGQLVMGQVTILKRGESLESAVTAAAAAVKEKEKEAAAADREGWDPAIFGRLGPDPEMIPKVIRLRPVAAPAAARSQAEVYAGAAFEMSPSPKALPLPSLSWRKDGCFSATKDLRLLLRLE